LALASFASACGDDVDPAVNTQTGSVAVGNGGGTPASSVGAGGLYEDPDPVASCADLCAALDTHCGGVDQQFPDAASCEAVCETYPEGMSDDVAGNTRGCRLSYAADDMAGADPATHCVRAGPVGTAPPVDVGDPVYCGSPCENFCDLAVAVCTETYLTLNDCLKECAAFDFTEAYAVDATTGFACRMAELTAASTDGLRCTNIVTDSPTCI
jgi:hypothetical protein